MLAIAHPSTDGCLMRNFLQVGLFLSLLTGCDAAPEIEDTSRNGGTVMVHRSGDFQELRYESVLQIGNQSGEVVFGRISSLAQAPDSTIWVVDQLDASVQIFSPKGARIEVLGRKGKGPGEFQRPEVIGVLSSGSALIWDQSLSRLTRLSSGDEPKVVATYPVTNEGPPPQPKHVTPEGTVVFLEVRLFHDLTPTSIMENPYSVLLGSLDGATHSFGEVAGRRWLWTGEEQLLLPFSANPGVDGASEVIAVIDGPQPAFLVGTIDSPPKRVEFSDLPPTPIELDPSGAYSDFWGQAGGPRAEAQLALLDRPDTPDRVPTFDRILGSSDGVFWLRRFHIDQGAPQVWEVVDLRGNWTRTVHLPARLRLLSVSPQVVGVGWDELGVETVHVLTPGS